MDDLSEFLATEVMGWHKDGPYWCDKHGEAKYGTAWHPRENIEQAMMCLERFSDYEIIKEGSILGVTIFGEEGIEVTGKYYNNNFPILSEAISLACAHARGWKE